MPSFTLCADFSIFPDDFSFGPSFTLAGMDFQDVAGGNIVSFVNGTAGERGLQFPDSGLEVDLPVPVPWARLRVGQFNGPYVIEGLDAGGNPVAKFPVNFPSSYRNIRLRGPGLSLIRLLGGGNEGVLAHLCVLIP